MIKSNISAIRGRLLWFTESPFTHDSKQAVRLIEDGVLCMEGGRLTHCGEARDILPGLAPGTLIDHYPDHIIMPGFIDAHVHYPQLQIMGSYGKKLLDWLEDYTFKAEMAFADPGHARIQAEFFCDELLRNGTTMAATYCTVHPGSADALFTAAEARDMAMIGGRVMMDRNAPAALLDTPELAEEYCRALIAKWHGRGRALYALTPRFAPSCSPQQLAVAGALRAEFPDIYVQSHLSENADEIKWVRELFPDHENYLSVYDDFGLTGPRSLLGHGIHLDRREWQSLSESQTTLVHCPTSNMFLGSGLFDMARARSGHIPVALGTDVGAGTSLSLITTLGEAYKVAHLKGSTLTAYQGFYLITLGGARALHLDHEIGAFEAGKMADITVLNPNATALLQQRMARVENMEEMLFVLMTLGDDRAVAATYCAGKEQYKRVI